LTFAAYLNRDLRDAWLGILGNHDYGGFQCFFNSTAMVFSRAQAQIDYDTEPDWQWPAPKKTRWVMPNMFYKKQVAFGNVTIDMFMIDTNFADAHDGPLACGQGTIRIPPACEGEDYDNCKTTCQKIGSDQAAWLKAELPKSNATWKFVIGHHPLAFIAPQLPGGIDFLRRNNVSAYFCGHIHGMAQSWYEATPSGFQKHDGPHAVPGAIFEMQNGAGGGSFPDTTIGRMRWGFTGIKVNSTNMEITFEGENVGANLTSQVLIAHSCVQNWPGTASCEWGMGAWGQCNNGHQFRDVWCGGGADKHCPTATKPLLVQACSEPSPILPPASFWRSARGIAVIVGSASLILLAVCLGAGCVVKKRAARREARTIAVARAREPLDISMQPSFRSQLLAAQAIVQAEAAQAADV